MKVFWSFESTFSWCQTNPSFKETFYYKNWTLLNQKWLSFLHASIGSIWIKKGVEVFDERYLRPISRILDDILVRCALAPWSGRMSIHYYLLSSWLFRKVNEAAKMSAWCAPNINAHCCYRRCLHQFTVVRFSHNLSNMQNLYFFFWKSFHRISFYLLSSKQNST